MEKKIRVDVRSNIILFSWNIYDLNIYDLKVINTLPKQIMTLLINYEKLTMLNTLVIYSMNNCLVAK